MGKGGMWLMAIVREGRRARKVRDWKKYSNHPTILYCRQGWEKEGSRRWRGGWSAATEPGSAGEAETSHGDAQHAKPGQTNQSNLGIFKHLILLFCHDYPCRVLPKVRRMQARRTSNSGQLSRYKNKIYRKHHL